FFQAEDGIRDPLVTGVQTCALPICSAYGRQRRPANLKPPTSFKEKLSRQLEKLLYSLTINRCRSTTLRSVLSGIGKSPYRKVLRSEEHTSELQSRVDLLCSLLLDKK